MSTFTRARAALLAVLVGLLMLWLGSGAAHASPLLDPPSASATLSEASSLDGSIYSSSHKEVKQGLPTDATREEVRYGTGVNRGNVPEVGTMNVFTPASPTGMLLVYSWPVNSLQEKDAPSRVIDKGELSDADVATINAALNAGVTVIIPNSLGDESPQYAGQFNGVRIVNAVQAYKNDSSHLQPSSVMCYGFSGSGIDCARVVEYQFSSGIIDTVIVDSGPTDLARFLENPAVQNGLGWSAAVGAATSLTHEEQEVLYANLRPSAIVGLKLLRAAADVVPVAGLVTGFMTVSGAFVPLPLKAAFLPGALDKPEVQELLTRLSPGVPVQPFDGKVVLRYNKSDAFVLPGVHSYPLAEQYRALGMDVTVITNHGVAAPGHAMMSASEMLKYMSGDIPSGDVDTYAPKLSFGEKVTNVVLTGAMLGISVYGTWLTEQAPAVLDELDRVVVDADEALDQVIAAPADAAEVVETAVVQSQQLLEQVTTPQSEAPTVNSETVIRAADEWLAPQDAQAVENFVSSAPVKELIDNAPVTLSLLPTLQ